MLFPTAEFAIFFIAVFALYWFTPVPHTIKKVFLILASYFYYGYWDPRFVLLLIGYSAVSYFTALYIQGEPNALKQKRAITYSVGVFLLLLGFFKYYGFLFINFNSLLLKAGYIHTFPMIDVLLPVGISFFTFQAISYLVDVKRGTVQASRSAVDVFLYISFFPQLVAGPIVRSSVLLPQIQKVPERGEIQVYRAAVLIMGGLFKKMIIANYLSTEIVDHVFQNPSDYSQLDTLFAIYGYSIQIYCDFSAYSDMAIGVALLLGFKYPDNFDQPYRSLSLQEFWKRWHISLSSWLRDYLYIPLGGSRKGTLMTYRNLILTMLLGGLWHGASWNFIIWGALHGFGLAVERFLDPFIKPLRENRFGKILMGVIVFHFVSLAWVYFRASDFGTATTILFRVVYAQNPTELITPFIVLLLVVGVLINVLPSKIYPYIEEKISIMPIYAQVVLFGLLFALLAIMSPDGVMPFIYFQF